MDKMAAILDFYEVKKYQDQKNSCKFEFPIPKKPLFAIFDEKCLLKLSLFRFFWFGGGKFLKRSLKFRPQNLEGHGG